MNTEVKNLVPLIEFLMELGNVLEKVVKDKNYGAFFNLTDELMSFQNVDWSKVIPELKGLDQEGKNKLQKAAKDKFDLKDDNIEFIIEEAISVLLSAGYLVKRCIDLKKKALE
tara:strand:+ start:3485 stop:3823 length:339 start_codon:yes stop_codon:yes gene_type:complete